MNVGYVNPFIDSCGEILQQVANISFTKGKMFVKQGMINLKDVSVTIGVFGNVTGNFHLNLTKDAALNIASAMMGGYQLTDLDELTTSAISELCNMIAGHAGMHFSSQNQKIDITPPDVTVNLGNSKRNYTMQAICIPLILSNGCEIDIDIALLPGK